MRDMKKILATTSAMIVGATASYAGGLDRASTPYNILSEEGYFVEGNIAYVTPSVTGTYPASLGGGSTGNALKSYPIYSFGVKGDINDKLSYALFLNNPYGADTKYTQGFYTGLEGSWNSTQLSAVLQYELTSGLSVYGGIRGVSSSANITIPDALIRGGLAAAAGADNTDAANIIAVAPAGSLAYSAKAKSDTRIGYVVGAAYEMPSIAFRGAITYESGYSHNFSTVETMAFFPGGVPGPGITNGTSKTKVKIPGAITLDLQSGIAKGTLLFGSVRYSNWSVWDVDPAGYRTLTGTKLTELTKASVTWRLGLGREITENMSVFGRLSYERKTGGTSTRLAPTDGRGSIGVGANYTSGNVKVTGAVEYIKVGGVVDASNVVFTDNHSWGFGARVSYKF